MKSRLGKCFLKKEDGSSAIMWAFTSEEMIAEGSIPLNPNDVVNGRKVKDWPVGVHNLESAVNSDGQPIINWRLLAKEMKHGKT
jgi:hypothetical protein